MSGAEAVIELAQIEAARERIAGAAVRTPLDSPARRGVAGVEIWCKLETLQPVNSFKIRGAVNCVRAADPALVAHGLVTASAGNMAQGVAWIARALGVPATIAVPEHAPAAKLDAIARLGGVVAEDALQRLVGGDRQRSRRRRRGLLRPPRLRPGGDGGQRDDRAGDPRGPAGG